MTTAPAMQLVGSAPTWVIDLVAGPRRLAPILHAGRDAVYVDLDGSCLAVLSSRAVQLPCGVRTVLPALPVVGAGDAAVVGDGAVELAGCEISVTGVVDATVPGLTPAAAARGAGQLARTASPRLRAIREAVPPAALAELAAGDPASVRRLLGLGPGLTPLGDDVLCGWLATAVARRHPALGGVRGAVALEGSRRTTTLSATLLGCASRGDAVPELRALLQGVATGDGPAVEQAVGLVLQVGDTSGAGLLLGALLALEAAT